MPDDLLPVLKAWYRHKTQKGPRTTQDDGLQNFEYWQGRAKEARRMADGMGDVTAKTLMLDIAYSYELVAQRAATGEARLGQT